MSQGYQHQVTKNSYICIRVQADIATKEQLVRENSSVFQSQTFKIVILGFLSSGLGALFNIYVIEYSYTLKILV